MKLVRVEKAELEKHGIPFARKTLYKWHSLGTYPGLLVKLGNRLFINYEKYEELVDNAIQKSLRRAKKTKELREREK